MCSLYNLLRRLGFLWVITLKYLKSIDGNLKEVLKGNTSLMFSEVGNTPAKLIKTFRKKSEKPVLKGAYIEEAIYIGDDQIDVLESIKSKEELIGEVITILQSPAKNVISALQSGGPNISGILKTLSER